jgi:hypothetical protein
MSINFFSFLIFALLLGRTIQYYTTANRHDAAVVLEIFPSVKEWDIVVYTWIKQKKEQSPNIAPFILRRYAAISAFLFHSDKTHETFSLMRAFRFAIRNSLRCQALLRSPAVFFPAAYRGRSG